MKICGIICEYNPFHKGHAYQIEQTRALLGNDTAIVCLMSGFFVQRGEAALYHRDVRVRQALACGADLVLALPLPTSLSSAEGFAAGSVDILHRLGIITHLSFGCESDTLADLTEIARILLEKKTIDDTIAHLSEGISYAAARERALYQRLQEKAQLIRSPNNILGVEYIKALLQQGAPITPLGIQRTGTDHDSCKIIGDFASASHIRQCILGGHFDHIGRLMPPAAYELLRDQPTYSLYHNENLVLSQLIRLSPADFAKYPDVSEGLEYRLYDAVQSSNSLDEIAEKAKSKRYPHARIRRILSYAFLDLTRNYFTAPLYTRALGFNETGQKLLGLCRKSSTIPILTKPAHVKQLSPEAADLFAKEALAARLYSMLGKENLSYSNEYKTRPIF